MDSVKRQRGGEHEDQPKTAVAALTKRQKVELGPRQPSCKPPSRLLWSEKHDPGRAISILLEGEKADDDPARGREADESDDPCPFESKGQKGKRKGKSSTLYAPEGQKSKGKSSTLYAPEGQKGKSKCQKGGKGKSKGHKGKKGTNDRSKGKDPKTRGKTAVAAE